MQLLPAFQLNPSASSAERKDISDAQQKAQAAVNVGFTPEDAANVFAQPQELKWKIINNSQALLSDPKLRDEMSNEIDAASQKFQKLYQQYSRDGGQWALEQSGLTPTLSKWTQLTPTLDAENKAKPDTSPGSTDSGPSDLDTAYGKYLRSSLQKAIGDTKSTPLDRANNITAAQNALAQFEKTGKAPNFINQSAVLNAQIPPVSAFSQLLPTLTGMFSPTPDRVAYPALPAPTPQSAPTPAAPMLSAPKPLMYITGNDAYNTATAQQVDDALNAKYLQKISQVKDAVQNKALDRDAAVRLLMNQF